jgi:hypothetical protein
VLGKRISSVESESLVLLIMRVECEDLHTAFEVPTYIVKEENVALKKRM